MVGWLDGSCGWKMNSCAKLLEMAIVRWPWSWLWCKQLTTVTHSHGSKFKPQISKAKLLSAWDAGCFKLHHKEKHQSRCSWPCHGINPFFSRMGPVIHAEEVNQSQAVLKALSLCVKRKGKRFQRFSAPECRSRSSGITLKDPELTDLTVTLGCTLASLNMGALWNNFWKRLRSCSRFYSHVRRCLLPGPLNFFCSQNFCLLLSPLGSLSDQNFVQFQACDQWRGRLQPLILRLGSNWRGLPKPAASNTDEARGKVRRWWAPSL